MKKYIKYLMIPALIMSFAMPVSANEYTATGDVVYDGTELIEGYEQAIIDATDYIQPGDTATITVEVKNESDRTVDFYANNTVKNTFEEGLEGLGEQASQRSAGTKGGKGANGGYTYEWTYEDEPIFESAVVGGDDKNGLKEIDELGETDTEFLYLCTLKPGESGFVKVKVGLDGQTLGNDYQNTDARIHLQFAVELTKPTKVVDHIKKVITGDSNMLWLYESLAIVSAFGLVTSAIKAHDEKEEA